MVLELWNPRANETNWFCVEEMVEIKESIEVSLCEERSPRSRPRDIKELDEARKSFRVITPLDVILVLQRSRWKPLRLL